MSTEPTVYQHGLNQAPIANVGKTGYYITKGGSRTLYRFPKEHTLPDGTIIRGQRLPNAMKRVRLTPMEHHIRTVAEMLKIQPES